MKKVLSVLLALAVLLTALVLFRPAARAAYHVGDIIQYGTYPQSRVTDQSLLDALNGAVRDDDWVSYGYYRGDILLYSGWWLRTAAADRGTAYLAGQDTDGALEKSKYPAFCCGVRPAIRLELPEGTADGDVIPFGSYPQTWVEDPATLAALNARELTWSSYGYYWGTDHFDGQMAPRDYMRYAEAELDGVRYRAVTFDYWRSNSHQKPAIKQNVGYVAGEVYWFRYEPIAWRVLDAAEGLLVSDRQLDAQPFSNYVLSAGYNANGYELLWGDAGQNWYASDYEHSSLRSWLNGTFYAAAFDAEERARIPVTTVSNLCDKTLDGETGYEAYDSWPTSDKVFLLSYEDAQNPAYFVDGKATRAEWTDYTVIQGRSSSSVANNEDLYVGSRRQSDFMRYADVVLHGEKYRGVVFDEYRPLYSECAAPTNDQSAQPWYGYRRNVVCWFRYEPVEWRVLDPEAGLVLSESVLDARAFNECLYGGWYYNDPEQTQSANDYTCSELRAWLNGDFLRAAFSDAQRDNIVPATLSNESYREDGYYSFGECEDRVFPLSVDDIRNPAYGFPPNDGNWRKNDPSRRAYGTDYAKCQGLRFFGGNEQGCCWWLRTPEGDDYNCIVSRITAGGGHNDNVVNETGVGVRPAMRLATLRDDPTGSPWTGRAVFMADGAEVAVVAYPMGATSIEEPPVPQKPGYSGVWGAYSLDGCITVEPAYYLNTYQLVFKADGEVIQSIPFTVETDPAEITPPAVPDKAGYTGAWESYTLTPEDITVNAVYTPIVYQATFLADGVVVAKAPFTLEMTPEDITPAVPQRIGYTGAWESFTLVPNDITVLATYTSDAAIGIKNVYELDYEETATYEADAAGLPEGATIHWFVNGVDVGVGESHTVFKPTDSFTLQTKVIDSNGMLVKESETVTVTVHEKICWYGDLDDNKTVTPEDARLALRIAVSLEETPGKAVFMAADVDKDGEITPADARLILRCSVHLETFDPDTFTAPRN